MKQEFPKSLTVVILVVAVLIQGALIAWVISLSTADHNGQNILDYFKNGFSWELPTEETISFDDFINGGETPTGGLNDIINNPGSVIDEIINNPSSMIDDIINDPSGALDDIINDPSGALGDIISDIIG